MGPRCGFVLAIMLSITASALAGEAGWILKFDFNDGEVGEKVPGFGAAGQTRFTTEQSYEGGKAVVLKAERGKENYGRWGARIKFPRMLKKGDQVWWRVRTFWPKGMDYSANPRLKFLRVHTCTPKGKNRGYNDVYMNAPGSDIPFQFIYEGAHRWHPLSTARDAVVPDTWETYEYYVKLDDQTVEQGGQARIRFWKNGKLLKDITSRKTLKTPEDYADCALLFTYWNSSPWVGRIWFREGGPFALKELVTSPQHPGATFRVEKIERNAVYLIDSRRGGKKKVRLLRPYQVLKPGQTLTGQTSRNTCTITEVLHTHPVMDIQMYVDDMVLTSKTPAGRDAKGNPCIGMGAKPAPAASKAE